MAVVSLEAERRMIGSRVAGHTERTRVQSWKPVMPGIICGRGAERCTGAFVAGRVKQRVGGGGGGRGAGGGVVTGAAQDLVGPRATSRAARQVRPRPRRGQDRDWAQPRGAAAGVWGRRL